MRAAGAVDGADGPEIVPLEVMAGGQPRAGYALRPWREDDAPALSAICSEFEV